MTRSARSCALSSSLRSRRGGTGSRRIDWLRDNIGLVTADLKLAASTRVKVLGAVVTSEPLLMPLVTESPFPVVAIDDLTTEVIGVDSGRQRPRRGKSRGR